MIKRLPLSYFLFFISYSLFLSSCSISKQINKQAEKFLFADSSIKQGHIGISIYDPSSKKYIYNHNAEKYLIPASNTKLFSWYAGMKYLGDSLVGLKYFTGTNGNQKTIDIIPTGDPTFLNKEYKKQPVFELLNGQDIITISLVPRPEMFGPGWAWNDFEQTYMAPRSVFPMNANLLSLKWISKDSILISPNYYNKAALKNPYFLDGFEVIKSFDNNRLFIKNGKLKTETLPFNPDLEQNQIFENLFPGKRIMFFDGIGMPNKVYHKLYSQPTDSLLKPMMHRSDNFFAEQTLLMVSNEKLGFMSDEAIIDTLLKYDLKDIPQKPRWVDGSGLSRYNLFTPQDFVWLLNKTKNEFDWERIKNILPTGGEGTLSSYYKDDAGFIYAKTGTLSNNCALSGYLITKKNKLLIFSVLVNNYPTGATPVRRAVEKFIKQIRQKY